ncbi:hypothetical protein AC579_3270 [Pseudocercospora musae]|uniref:F-box domain-containing protein n=1 Tax=Pseudocercospora musae TaxID=113226 RepID=A0A139IDA0_9PEZI|nr:hypothetical protein AC579_3270 [Pseudocercospora musae]
MPKRSAADQVVAEPLLNKRLHVAKADQPPKRAEATFLGLPLELREEIYRFVCGNLPDPPVHPYDDFPPNFDFDQSLALPLLNRQTRLEVQTLLRREYPPITFYFDDVPTLYDWREELIRRRCHKDARFLLRSRTDVRSRHPRGNMIKADIEEVIEDQPGFEDVWSGSFGYYSWGRQELDLYTANKHFRIEAPKRGEHNHGSSKGRDCIPYLEATYPALHKSLRLKGFAWEHDELHEELGPQDYAGGLILEGKLCDLRLDAYNIHRGRFRLAAHLGEVEWDADTETEPSEEDGELSTDDEDEEQVSSADDGS